MEIVDFVRILTRVPGAYLERIVGVDVLRFRREWGEVGALSAVLEHVTGERIPTTQWRLAAEKLGLDARIAQELVAATDGDMDANEHFRAIMLQVAAGPESLFQVAAGPGSLN